MGLNRIYRYWEGKKPAYIDMCRDSLHKHCGDSFEIIEMDSCDNPYNLKINHKTDLLKGRLIRDNGGFWIDADMIVLKDLKPLIKLFDKTEFMGIPGFFGGKPKSKILVNWVKEMEKMVKGDLTFSDLIQPLLNHPQYKPYKYFTHEMITPIWYTEDEFHEFFGKGKLEDFITDNTYVVTLYNSQFSDEFKNMSREEILSKDWLISKMFKKALCE